MDERTPGWDEHDSHDFIDLGRFFVPDREEQVAAVLDMVPDPGDGLLVDLCCGEGLLSRASTGGPVLAVDGGGSHWLKYGSARNHVLSLQVVLATGEVCSQ